MQYEGYADSLRLLSTGEYRHHLWDAGTLAFSETGKWEATTKDGDPAVELAQYSGVLDDPRPHIREPGWWIAPLERDREGRVIIIFTRDIGLHYTRISSTDKRVQ